MEEKPTLFKRLPKPIRLGLDLGRLVVGVKGFAMLWALGIGILPTVAVVLADLPPAAKILGGTSAFLLSTAAVGHTIAWWKRRSTVDPLRRERQSALDDLARKLKEGREIKNDRDLPAGVWSQRNQSWQAATEKLLDNRFFSAEASLFRASEPRNVPGGRKDVARDLAGLNGKLEVLREILGTGRAE